MNTSPAAPYYVLAISRAQYRGVLIFETGEEICIFVGQKKYEFVNLAEATAFIDACYAAVITLN